MQFLMDCQWYWVPLCLLAGAAYGAALYGWNARRGTKGGARRGKALVLLTAARVLTVTLLALLLTGPVMKRKVTGVVS